MLLQKEFKSDIFLISRVFLRNIPLLYGGLASRLVCLILRLASFQPKYFFAVSH